MTKTKINAQGLKRQIVSDCPEEASLIRSHLEKLRTDLSGGGKLHSAKGKTIGEWDDVKCRAKISKKHGHWNWVGFSENNESFLHAHEALNLLELKRILLTYNGIPVSVQQGYAIMLGRTNCLSLEQYLVYAKCYRFGYNIQVHKAAPTSCTKLPRQTILPETACVWRVLEATLNPQREVVRDHVYEKVAMSMKSIVKRTCSYSKSALASTASESDAGQKFGAPARCAQKRNVSLDEQPTAKRRKVNEPFSSPVEEAVDRELNTTEFRRLRDVFTDLQIKRLSSLPEIHPNAKMREMSFDFDLYLHNDAYKKSELSPASYRILIQKHGSRFPTRNEIQWLKSKTVEKCPVIVVLLSSTLSSNAYIVYS